MGYSSSKTLRQPRRFRHASWLTAGTFALCLALAACGGASSPGVAAGSTTATSASRSASGNTQGAGLVAYASCMRSHGVANFPGPSGGGGIPKQAVISAFREVSNSQTDAAESDCRHLLPAGGSLSGQTTQPITAHEQQDYLKAAGCMRSHGFTNFPDPTFSAGTVNMHIPSSIDTNSPQFNQARQICQRLIPRGLPYSGS
jgi:hypothetical protein